MKSHNSQIKLINQLWLVNQNGFTLLELLVAILAVTLFVAFSLEGMVLATFAQIRAREKAEAMLFIQRNLEDIRSIAANYGIDPPFADSEELADRCSGIGGGVDGTPGNEGLAAGLAAQISAVQDPEIANPTSVKLYASNRTYPVARNITASATNPNLLEIRYTVSDGEAETEGNTDVHNLAELYTEVIPNVSLQCP